MKSRDGKNQRREEKKKKDQRKENEEKENPGARKDNKNSKKYFSKNLWIWKIEKSARTEGAGA